MNLDALINRIIPGQSIEVYDIDDVLLYQGRVEDCDLNSDYEVWYIMSTPTDTILIDVD